MRQFGLRSVDQGKFSRGFLVATAIVIAVILYGSLYPFAFRAPIGGVGPASALLRSWAVPPQRGDFIANVLFYTPLGFFGLLAIGGKTGRLPGFLLVTAAGALLSTSMELAQYYIAGRVTAANDVYANVAGTALGALAGSVAYRRFSRPPLGGNAGASRVPVMLLALWLGYRLYPWVPVIDLHKYWDALKPVLLYPSLTGYDLFRYTAIWLTVGALIEALAGPKRAWLAFPLFIVAVLAAKVAIVGKTLGAGEITGAAIAVAGWLVVAAAGGARIRATLIALLLFAYVVVERLAPFQFTVQRRHFGWIPFYALMHGSAEVNILSFFEKAFLYGSLIWLLGKVGLRTRTATILVALMLFATSWAETHLAGRSAEITDALMAVLIGVMIAAVDASKPSGRSANAKP